MKCKKCKSIEATIYVANVGNFCLDCHNDYMAELLGVIKMDDFSKIISGYDADGIMHRFEISNMIMPGFSVWKAEEIEGGYQFEIFVKPEDNQAVAIEHLHQNILTGLGYKTLTHLSDRYFIDNAIQIDKEQYRLNSVAMIRPLVVRNNAMACVRIYLYRIKDCLWITKEIEARRGFTDEHC